MYSYIDDIRMTEMRNILDDVGDLDREESVTFSFPLQTNGSFPIGHPQLPKFRRFFKFSLSFSSIYRKTFLLPLLLHQLSASI